MAVKVISNKEYPEIEGCIQTVPVWLFSMKRDQIGAVWLLTDVWLLHDDILIAGNHLMFVKK